MENLSAEEFRYYVIDPEDEPLSEDQERVMRTLITFYEDGWIMLERGRKDGQDKARPMLRSYLGLDGHEGIAEMFGNK